MSDVTLTVDDAWEGPSNEGPGSRIGPYTLVRRLGEGGFGDVYEAAQEQPVRRHVALKIVKLGMDSREVIARFDGERQALAMMDHPHIARVFDAGTTESGRPYFVMELVAGEPITAFCDAQQMTIEARLRLFEQVCAAVQHAHGKGVIHRDLKPGNVLVSLHDGRPFAKVIDFGIAKAVTGRLTDRTLATRHDQVMGTPLYMSPEQARGSPDVDTRSDIYSLGVILYELLTGSTPVERTALLQVSLADTQRLICEAEPPLPSARLMKLATTLAGAVNFRAIDPRRLARTVKGDLDWIVMKALEKEPARRYETASALGADIGRFLAGRPVLAAPPTLSYRAGKFVRRHKAIVSAAGVVAVALLAGIGAFAWQARIAGARARELDRIARFQADMLGQVDPTQAGKLLSDDVRKRYLEALAKDGVPEKERTAQADAFARDWGLVNATDASRDLIDDAILKPAARTIAGKFADQPLVAARLRLVLGKRYFAMGLYEQALPLEREALATRRRLLGDRDRDTLAAMGNLAMTLRQHGELVEAESWNRRAMDGARHALGTDDAMTLDLIGNMATILDDQGRIADAETYQREALAIRRRVLGANHPDTLLSIENMGVTLQNEDRFAEAEPLLREAMLGMRQVHGADDPTTLYATGNLGYVLELEGKYAEAEALDRDVLAKIRGALGENHAITLLGVKLYGGLLVKEQRYAQALALLAPAEAATRRAYPGDNAFRIGQLLFALGGARRGMGDYATAEKNLLEAYDLLDRVKSPTRARDLRECAQALVDLYTAWDRAEPGRGHDRPIPEWRRRSVPGAASGERQMTPSAAAPHPQGGSR